MSNPFKQHVRHFLSFPRSDRNAIVILGTILFVVIVCLIVLRNMEPVPQSDFLEIESILADWENKEAYSEPEIQLSLFDFDPNTISSNKIDSLDIPADIKRNLLKYRSAGGKYKSPIDVRKIYGMNDSIYSLLKTYIQIKQKEDVKIKSKNKVIVKPVGTFDPNSVTVTELVNYGFSQYQANNLVNYRIKGGVYLNPTDMLKIYGIDSVFYLKVEEFIEIEKPENEDRFVAEENIIVELNSADSLELTQLNGIGPSYATRIIKYRNLLGGYYSKVQLKEVYKFPKETYSKIQLHVYADTLKVSKLRINFSEFAELLRHPYLNKTQVKALLDKREADGPIKDISELQSIKAFDSETIRKIEPYITCR